MNFRVAIVGFAIAAAIALPSSIAQAAQELFVCNHTQKPLRLALGLWTDEFSPGAVGHPGPVGHKGWYSFGLETARARRVYVVWVSKS